MRPTSSLVKSKLEWARAARDELRADGEAAIRLALEGISSGRAIAEFDDRRIAVERIGFLGIRVRVRNDISHAELGLYVPDMMASGGTFKPAAGAPLLWRQPSFGVPNCEFRDLTGNAKVVFRPVDRTANDGAHVRAEVDLPSVDDLGGLLPVLLSLGWFLIVAHADDEEAAMAAALAMVT